MIGTKKTLLGTPVKDLYALTISPPQRTGCPKTLYKKDRDIIYYYIPKFSNHFILFPEFSQCGRLHYHGIIKVTDKYKFYHTKHLLDNLGFTMWKPLKDYQGQLAWLTYCKKDLGITRLDPFIYKTNCNYKKTQYTTVRTPDKIDKLNDDILYAKQRLSEMQVRDSLMNSTGSSLERLQRLQRLTLNDSEIHEPSSSFL